MQLISLKTGFLALTLTAFASVTACSTSSQNQAQNPNTADTGGMPGMDHGSGMNHNMAMDLGPADADYELRFLDAMTPHHLQNPNTADTGGMPGMDHGSGMNHNMAMDLGPADADYELRFLDAMTPHHQ